LTTLSEIIKDTRKEDNEVSWNKAFLTTNTIECNKCGIIEIKLDMAIFARVKEENLPEDHSS